MPAPLEWQHVLVPLAGGLGTDADQRMRAPERLEVARNVRSPEIGTLGKRYGFKPITAQIAGGGGAVIADNGPLRALGATSKELLALGHRNLYGWNSFLTGWVDRGHISPCVGNIQEVFRANVQYEQADGDRYANAVIYAAVRYESWGDAVPRRSLEFRGVDINGDTLFAPAIEERTITTDVHPYSCRVVANGFGATILWAQGDPGGAGPSSLKRYEYDNVTPSASPVAIGGAITGDLYVRSNTRTYDGITGNDGDYIVAFIDKTNQNINLIRYDQTHAATDTDTIVGDFYAVALCEADDGHIYVLALELGETHNLKIWHQDATLANIWGPQTVYAFGIGETGDNLGIVEGNNGTNLRGTCVWAVKEAGVYSRSVNPATGVPTDAAVPIYSTSPLSRPFYYRNRCYAHVSVGGGTGGDGLGFGSHILLDLMPEDATRVNGGIAMAALWGVGSGTGLTLGSVNNVWAMADGVTYRMVCPFLGEVIKATTVGGLVNADVRRAFDDVGFEFDAIPMAAPLHRGAAVIGGGYVAWYDGSVTFELGFSRPPMVESTTQSAGVGTVPAGTHTYSNVWQHVDGAAIQHRSPPSPGKAETFAGPKNVTLVAFSLPGSRRPYADMTCQWFRASDDAVPRRVNRSAENIPNTVSAKTVQALTDTHPAADIYVPQYTVGGVLESVAPEGARIPFVTRERLWLGDFFRGNRIQYSKLVVPSTAGETAIAPELFEALGRISDNGELITGLSALDAATVIFTSGRIYLVGGYGPDATGHGDDTSRLTEIMTDTGCIEPRSVVQGPDGVFFQTERGIYLLTRNHEVKPIGEPVRDLTDVFSTVTSAVVVAAERQVRFTVTDSGRAGGRILVYDYRIGEWFEWEIKDSTPSTVIPIGAVFVDGIYYIAGTDGKIRWEDTSTHYDDSVTYPVSIIETAEINPGGPLQWMHVQEMAITAERKDAHSFTIEVYDNYGTAAASVAAYTDVQIQALADAANREQFLYKPNNQQKQSMRVRMYDGADGTPTNAQGFEIHALALVGAVPGQLPHDGQQARM